MNYLISDNNIRFDSILMFFSGFVLKIKNLLIIIIVVVVVVVDVWSNAHVSGCNSPIVESIEKKRKKTWNTWNNVTITTIFQKNMDFFPFLLATCYYKHYEWWGWGYDTFFLSCYSIIDITIKIFFHIFLTLDTYRHNHHHHRCSSHFVRSFVRMGM